MTRSRPRSLQIGRVDVNGQPAKPHREIKPGDEIVISRPLGHKQTVVVQDLAERHIAKADARALYEDRTPKPTEEEIEMRRMARLARAFSSGPVAKPDKRERRRIRRIKGDSDEGGRSC